MRNGKSTAVTHHPVSSCPSCSATDGVVRNGKSTAGHQRYLCSARR
ncbi:hypothetical protein PS007_24510, partial [Shigella sonnei]|nr:hypothetical protein [Shigella sonnei]